MSIYLYIALIILGYIISVLLSLLICFWHNNLATGDPVSFKWYLECYNQTHHYLAYIPLVNILITVVGGFFIIKYKIED